MMSYDFSGQRALVTGAGKGIGRETAKALARNGAEVIAVSRTQEDLDSLKQEIPGVVTLCVDVSDIAATRAAVSNVGGVDLLVNNAAIAELQSFLDVTEEVYDKVMNINVKAALFLSQMVAKGMIARGKGGAIVNVSSVASMVAIDQHTTYSASKAALDMLTKTMGLELGKHKIRVNSVNPTVVMTAMGKQNWSDPAKAGPVKKRIPTGEFIEVDEVVNAILFLLSNSASGISCSTLPIDAGYHCCS